MPLGACVGSRITCRRTVLSRVLRIEPWLSGSRLASPKGPILEIFQAVSGIPFCFDDLSLIPETHAKDKPAITRKMPVWVLHWRCEAAWSRQHCRDKRALYWVSEGENWLPRSSSLFASSLTHTLTFKRSLFCWYWAQGPPASASQVLGLQAHVTRPVWNLMVVSNV